MDGLLDATLRLSLAAGDPKLLLFTPQMGCNCSCWTRRSEVKSSQNAAGRFYKAVNNSARPATALRYRKDERRRNRR